MLTTVALIDEAQSNEHAQTLHQVGERVHEQEAEAGAHSPEDSTGKFAGC
jgi:hypothetical protein